MAKKTSRAKSVKRGKSFNKREFSLFMLAFAVVGVFTLWISLAAPHHSGGKPKPGSGSGTISLVMVTDNHSDGLVNFGDTVTFSVSSTVSYPWVQISCNQNGMSVLGQYIGFYAGYPWSQNVILSSYLWPSGAADCTARLYDSSTNITLATLSFHVNP